MTESPENDAAGSRPASGAPVNPIALPLRDIVPPPSLFRHHSELHGQRHVARVMVHAFRLVQAVGAAHLAAPLWAAVYIHDIARWHDGESREHGVEAWLRLLQLPDVRALFARAGVADSDYPAIKTAVTSHSHGEIPDNHPHRRLAALLKDADGLDRVRLGDLDPAFFRHVETAPMIAFAEALLDESRSIPEGPDHFAQLWPVAVRLVTVKR